jgi:hypothetical protein
VGALAPTLICALILGAGAEEPPLLVFSGNAVLNDEVYRAVIDLPREARATASNARMVRTRTLDFLRRAGYVLATVKARVEGEQIQVEIDEGRVDKVIVLGQGAYHTLRVKLELSIPHNVFNRPEVQKQVREVARRYDFKDYRIELVPVEKADHVGPQIENLGKIQDLDLIPPARPYELHITFESRGFEPGFAPELSFNSLEGLGAGARFRLTDLLFDEDRLELRARAAASLRSTIDETRRRPVLSRAFAESKWHSPPLIGKNFRSFLWLRADLLNRQRGDLGIESFFYSTLEASLNAEYRFFEGLSTSLGAGLEYRRLFAIDRAEVVSPIVDQTPRSQRRPFAVAAVELLLNPDETRRDHRHRLDLEARGYLRAEPDRENSLRLQYVYEAPISFGYHELWIKSRGASFHGDDLFPDEHAIGGNYLRGPFVDTFYVRRLASLGLEFRVSLVRDRFKISLFHDAVVFGMIDRVTDETTDPAAANAVGLGAHVLILDAFQFDAYYGVGFAVGDRFDHGLVLSLKQAF